MKLNRELDVVVSTMDRAGSPPQELMTLSESELGQVSGGYEVSVKGGYDRPRGAYFEASVTWRF